jgi:hypothetical protein
MKNRMITFVGAAFFAASAAASAPQPVEDRVAEMCSVSNTDLEGQRLARACRAELRTRFAAEQAASAERAASGKREPVRTAEATPVRPR